MSEMESTGVHGIVIASGSADQAAAVVRQQVEQAEAEADLRRGPWTAEEDLVLVNYIAVHGEGRWNSLARSAGLKRSGKSCRLRWLNYLRPDVRRGNINPEEQLLILELHSRWGNRWSKIAQHLPGRTDNEIKNYWRTRVQRHAKQLKCDVNSQQFKDAVQRLWIPRLLEKIQAGAADPTSADRESSCTVNPYAVPAPVTETPTHQTVDAGVPHVKLSPEHSSTTGTSSEYSSAETWLSSTPVSNLTDSCVAEGATNSDCSDTAGQIGGDVGSGGYYPETLLSPSAYLNLQGFPDFEQGGWGLTGAFSSECFWAADDSWFLQQQM